MADIDDAMTHVMWRQHERLRENARVSYFCGWQIYIYFFQLLTHKIFTCDNFWNLTLKRQNHTINLQNHIH